MDEQTARLAYLTTELVFSPQDTVDLGDYYVFKISDLTRFVSAVISGAATSYVDAFEQLVQESVPVPDLCERIAECIANSESVQNALAQYLAVNGFNQGDSGLRFDEDGNLIWNGVASETNIGPDECADERLFGFAIELVSALDEYVIDLLEQVRTVSNLGRLAADLGDNLEVVSWITSLAEFALWLEDQLQSVYEGASTQETRDFVACLIYCYLKDKCAGGGLSTITIEETMNVIAQFVANEVDNIPGIQSPPDAWFSWFASVIVEGLTARYIVAIGCLLILAVMRSGGKLFDIAFGNRPWAQLVATISTKTAGGAEQICEDCGEYQTPLWIVDYRVAPYFSGNGTHVLRTGWQDVLIQSAGVSRRQVAVGTNAVPSLTVTGLGVRYALSKGTFDLASTNAIEIDINNSVTGLLNADVQSTANANTDAGTLLPASATRLFNVINASRVSGTSDPGGSATIRQMRIYTPKARAPYDAWLIGRGYPENTLQAHYQGSALASLLPYSQGFNRGTLAEYNSSTNYMLGRTGQFANSLGQYGHGFNLRIAFDIPSELFLVAIDITLTAGTDIGPGAANNPYMYIVAQLANGETVTLRATGNVAYGANTQILWNSYAQQVQNITIGLFSATDNTQPPVNTGLAELRAVRIVCGQTVTLPGQPILYDIFG